MIYWIIFCILVFSSLFQLIPNGLYNSYSIKQSEKMINQYIYFISSFLLIVVAAFRYKTGADWQNYMRFFDECDLNKSFDFEKGFIYLNILFKYLFKHFFILQLFISISCGIIIYNFIWNESELPIITLLYYYCFYFFFLDMAQTRQNIALAIIILGLRELKKDNVFIFFVYILIAYYFHVSALIAFLFVFIKRTYTNKFYILLITISIILLISGSYLFEISALLTEKLLGTSSRISHLFLAYFFENDAKKISINTIINFLFKIFVGILGIKNKDKITPLYLNSFFLGLIISSLSYYFYIFDRISYYFMICGGGFFIYNELIPRKYNFFIKEKYLKLFIGLIYLIYLSYFFIIFATRTETLPNIPSFNEWNPYKDFIFNNE